MKKPKPKVLDPMPLVYVEWRDSAGMAGWHKIEDFEEEAFLCCSVGWMMSKNKDCLTLIPHLQIVGKTRGCDFFTIPREAVTKIKTLKIKP